MVKGAEVTVHMINALFVMVTVLADAPTVVILVQDLVVALVELAAVVVLTCVLDVGVHVKTVAPDVVILVRVVAEQLVKMHVVIVVMVVQ